MLDAEIAESVRRAEAEAGQIRAAVNYDDHRRRSIREARLLAQWMRALMIAESDADLEPLRELLEKMILGGGTVPMELRARVGSVNRNPPSRKPGDHSKRLDAAQRAASMAYLEAARRVFRENTRPKAVKSLADRLHLSRAEIVEHQREQYRQRKAELAVKFDVGLDTIEAMLAKLGTG